MRSPLSPQLRNPRLPGIGAVCAALSVLLGTAATPAPTGLELCEKATAMGWREQDGWVFSPSSLRTNYAVDAGALAGISRLVEALRAQGTTLVMVVVPPRSMVVADRLSQPVMFAGKPYSSALARDNYESVLAALRGVGAVPVDLFPASQADPEAFFLFNDSHWSADGARRTGQAVAATIRTLPGNEQLPPRQFSTVAIAPAVLGSGWLGGKIRDICGGDPVPLTIERTRTTPVGVGLLDEGGPPQVVLVGTSFSGTEHFNFSGTIEQALGADVLPVPIAGGGTTAAMRSFLPDPAFHEAPPKFLVWEFPLEHFPPVVVPGTVNDPLIFRELEAAARGPCPTTSVATTTGTWAAPTVAIFADLSTKKLNGAGAYLHLTLGDATVRKFVVTTTYTNGANDGYTFSLPDRVDNGGEIYLSFDPARGETLSSVAVATEGTAPNTTFKAELCATARPQR